MRRVFVAAGFLLVAGLCSWAPVVSGSSEAVEPLPVSGELRGVQPEIQARCSGCKSRQGVTVEKVGERWHSSYKTCVDAESGICSPITY